jgi:hypothetical protein
MANYRFADEDHRITFYRDAHGRTKVEDFVGFYPRKEAVAFASRLPDLLNGVDFVSTFGGELTRRYL